METWLTRCLFAFGLLTGQTFPDVVGLLLAGIKLQSCVPLAALFYRRNFALCRALALCLGGQDHLCRQNESRASY